MTLSGGGAGGAVDTAYVDVTVRHNGEQSMRELETEIEQGGTRAGEKGGSALKGAMGNALGALSGMALAAGTAVAGAVVAGMGAAVDIASQAAQGQREFQAQLGVTATEAEKLGEVAKRVFANNWGDSLADAQNGVLAVRQQLKGLSDDDLQRVTEGAYSISDTFGSELPEVANTVKSLMGDMGLSAQEALDFISRGFQNGLNGSDDFLDSIREYAPQFKEAGFSAQEMYSVFETGLKGGVLGTDKVADLVKEFRVRIQDGSKTTSDGLKQLGIDSDALAKKMATGQVSVADAFNLVIGKLKATKDQNTVMQAGVALLGTQFEDLGQKAVLAIDPAKRGMKDLEGATAQVNERYNTLGSVFQGVWRQVLLQLEPVGKELLDLANDAMPAIKEALSQVGPVASTVVRFLLDGFRQGREAVGSVAPVFQTVFGVLRSVAAQVLPYVMKALGDLKPVVQSLGPLFSAAFNLVAQLWKTVLQPALRDILPVVSSVFGAVAAAVRGAIGIVTGVINAVVALLRGDLPGAVRALEGAFEAGVKGAVAVFRNLGAGVLNIIRAVAPQMYDAAKQVVAGLLRGIEQGAGQVVQAARNLAGNVIDGIKARLRIQSPSKETYILGEHAVTGFANGIEKTTPRVQSAVAGLTATVLSETEKAQQALEKSISWDAWVKGLRSATQAQLQHAQAQARSAGDADRYNAVTAELTRRQDAAAAATQRATEAAQRLRQELADNRAQIAQGEAMERYLQGLRSATPEQLAHALATARAAGDIDHYNAIKSEQARRTDAATAASDRATEAARREAGQLAQNRQSIADTKAEEAWRQSLAGLTDAQIAQGIAAAEAAGNVGHWNDLVAEQRRRADEAAQSVSDLVDQEIRLSNARYQNTQGATDSAYRLSYGAGDEGLIRSLAGVTGRTIAQVRDDVEGALAQVKGFSSETAGIIERVWSEALAHRREVGAAERADAEATAQADQRAYGETKQFILDTLSTQSDAGLLRLYDEAHARRDVEVMTAVTAEIARRTEELNARILASDQDTSRARTQAIAEIYRADQEAADDAAITVDSLTGQIAELIAQGRDPTKSGFVDWLDELIQKGGLAGEAAAYVKANLDNLIQTAKFNAHVSEPLGDPSDARPTRAAPEVVTPSEARPTPAAPMTPSLARGSQAPLTQEQLDWQASVRAKQALDAYRESLRGATGEELERARVTTLASGQQDLYNAVLDESARRARATADTHKAWADNLDRLAQGEWVAGLKQLSDSELQAALEAARASENVAQFNSVLAEIKDRQVNVTLNVMGMETGLKKLDFFKSALQGVVDLISKTFEELVSGAEVTASGVVKSMAIMALGIVKQVAIAVAAYAAQMIAQALVESTVPVIGWGKAAATLAVAAAIAGIAAGLQARLSQQASEASRASSAAASFSSGTPGSAGGPDNSSVTIPTSQVTVIAAPEWVAQMGNHIDRMGAYITRLVTEGIHVQIDAPQGSPGAGRSLGWDLGTGRL
ncbi:hypothetical protein DAERI_060101 [Deinococcus aerius]|uniref:Phage tail tape measure protein domain-containing protein n=1 Tax=Deinococcus aerius TaxID=200253 RepID=A0A2I9DLJ3_9DEIO|nr:phage tail tape measure protein [Deinococcus aerius]GBF05841.1 hypothetical protein DAERI_060101 [Deinococcus aerius]